MHARLLTLGCVVSLLATSRLVAQSDSAVQVAPTPAACLTAVTAWRTARTTALRVPGQVLDVAPILRDAQALARRCVARFPVDQLDPAQIAAFADLAMLAADTVRARAAIARSFTIPGLTPRQRGEAMLTAERVAMAGIDPFAGLVTGAEAIVVRLDSLPDSLATLKISGHQRLLSQYEYADIDEGIQRHARAIIDIARRVRNSTPSAATAMVSAFVSLARAAGDYLHPDSAIVILDAAARELAAVPSAANAFKASRDRYALVGQRATALTGDRWVNAPDVPATVAFGDGKVYLIQFTAHWCVPCRKSYPGLLAVHERLKGQPFEILFETELYGNFEGKQMSAEQEIAADKTYYKEHHGLPFRVAITAPASRDTTGRRPVAPTALPTRNATRYLVSGIPQTVVIDKKGIIRQVVVGGDKGNEERLGRLVEQLLKER